MKNYSILSKSILILSFCGTLATLINLFTGIINSKMTTAGSVVCIMGFVISGYAIITLEQEKEKRRRVK